MTDKIGGLGNNAVISNQFLFNREIKDDEHLNILAMTKPIGSEHKLNLRESWVNIEADPNPDFPEKVAKLIDNSRLPKPSNSSGNALGRAILWFVNLCSSKSSTTLSTTEKLQTLRNKVPEKLQEPVNKTPISMSTERFGKLTGLTHNTKIVPFTEDQSKNLQEILFPYQEPRLEDVKQNPQLQDCWFLSAITSMLVSQGTASITRLFSPSEKLNHVNIRLGENIYEVPLGRISDSSGDKHGSNSANWVVALENAMTMHLAVHARADHNDPNRIDKEDAQLALHSASEGILALQGRTNQGDAKEFLSFAPAQDDAIKAIKKFLDGGKPVVLGHSSKWVALSDGIAPKHAVTVLHAERNKLIVLDPYGEVKSIKGANLKEYTMAVVKTEDEVELERAKFKRDFNFNEMGDFLLAE